MTGALYLRRCAPAAALACVLATLLALTSAPASAFTGHAFSSSFGSSGAGAGELSLASNSGVAVNSATHDIYVADTGNRRVDHFSSSGTFIRAWGWGVTDGLPSFETCSLICQAGVSGAGVGQFTTPTFIAVDNSGGPSAGDIYVGDSGTNLVQKFDASGNAITSWGSGGQLNGSAATGGPFTAIAGIALDTAGKLFVFDPNPKSWFEFGQDGTADPTVSEGPITSESSNVGVEVDGSGNLYKVAGFGGVWKYESSGSFVGRVDFLHSDMGFTIDPATTDIYVDDSGSSIRHFDSSCVPSGGFEGTPCTPTDSFGSGDLVGGADLAVDSSNRTVYAADVGNQRIAVFIQGLFADVTTNPATAVTPTTATVNGHLDPAGNGNVIDCHFQYVTEAAFLAHGYEDPSVASAPCAEGNSFSAPADVHADLSTLQPGTTYHFRLDATNAQGQNQGADETFTTPPAVKDVATNPCSNVQGHSATLNGTLDPNGSDTTYHFQYVDDAAFQASGYSGATSAPVPDADAGSTPGDEAVHVDVAGLQPATTYHFRLLATNIIGTTLGQDETCTTLPPPSIDSAVAADLTLTSANLTAKINPNGSETTYHFEYGTTTGYGTSVPVPDADIGSGSSDVSVAQHITGLSENTTYHWRVLATNSADTATSTDHSFIYNATGASLPDGRAYEMVTPPQKNGAAIGATSFFGLPLDVAVDGSRVFASSIQCFAGAGSCNGRRVGGVGSSYEFTRTSSAWLTTPLAPPASEFQANTPWAFNATGGTALLSMPTPPFGEDDLYVRRPDGSFRDLGPSTPPEEGAQGPRGGNGNGGGFQAGTADFSHFVWESVLGLWHSFDDTQPGGASIYEYSGTGNSQPLLVGVSGGAGSHDLISVCGSALGGITTRGKRQGVMSSDGRTVFFTALAAGASAPCPSGSGANAGTPVPANTLYARVDGELPDAHMISISAPSPSECGSGPEPREKACQEAVAKPAGAQFEGASSDGSRAFFTSTQQLTDGASEDSESADNAASTAGCVATVGPNGCNLYEYDFGNPSGHKLLALSAGDTSGGGPRVQGVMALSPDGTHVYFIAKGVLSGAANDRGQSAQDGTNNLYVFERDGAHPGGLTTFITALPTSDRSGWNESPGKPANVTADGRFLVFVSHRALTADDTSASRANQVFRYDAATGKLARISLGNDGFNDNGNRSTATPCGAGGECIEDAAIVSPVASGRPHPSMSDNGQFVFFSSPVGLTRGAPDDVQIATNSGGDPIYAQNVYEWHEGHVYLISDGRDVSVNGAGSPACVSVSLSSVCLLGSDASGANVFFATNDRLVGQDTDTELDYYDARICTPASPCLDQSRPPATVCEGDTCQVASPPQPALLSVATATFSGPGNASPGGGSPPAKVKVLRHVVRGSTFLLTVAVPGKGAIAITANGTTALRRSLTRAGSFRFALTLTRRARAALRRRHGHKMTVHVHIRYTPANGPASTANLAVTVKA